MSEHDHCTCHHPGSLLPCAFCEEQMELDLKFWYYHAESDCYFPSTRREAMKTTSEELIELYPFEECSCPEEAEARHLYECQKRHEENSLNPPTSHK